MTQIQTPRWYPWAFLALVLAYLAIHVGAWQAPLCFLDDTGELLYVRGVSSWHDLLTRDFYGFFRPVKNLLFLGFDSLIHAGGMQPAHAVAMGVGLASLLAVNHLFRRLLGGNPATALAASALWLLAPTLVSCTAWLSCVNIQAMTGFMAGAVILHLRAAEVETTAARRRAWAGLAACSFLAMLCYEGAVCLPALLMATDLWLHPERVRTRTAWRGYLLAVMMLALVLALRALGGSRGQLSGSFGEISRLQVACASAHFMLLHLGIWLWPFGRQALFGGYYAGQAPTAALALEWLALALLAAAVLVWRRRAPRVTLGVAWFFIAFAPMSNVLGFKNGPYGDYYMAAASLGLALAGAAGAEALVRSMAGVRRGWRTALALAALTAGIGWRLTAAVESADWARAWNDPLVLLERSARTFPEAFDVLTELAKRRVEQGQYAESRALVERAIARAPKRGGAYAVLAVMAERRGDTPAAWAALRRFGELAKSHAALAWYWYFAGYLCEERDHDSGRAEKCYRQALAGSEAWTADHVSAAQALGLLLAARGRPAEAVPLLQRAAALTPDHASLQHNLAVALNQTGRQDEARLHERRYRELTDQAPVTARH